MSIVDRADAFAAEAHAGQTRKSSDVPAVEHARSVARLLVEAGCDEETVAAALLHDTVEDIAHVTVEQIRDAFGGTVALIVEGVTEDKTRTWEQRKRATLLGLPALERAAAHVALADKLDNARSLLADLEAAGDALWRRFNAPLTRQRRYHRALATAFEAREDLWAGLVTDYRRTVNAVFPPVTTALGPLLAAVRDRCTNPGSTIHGDAHWRTVAAVGRSLLDAEPLADPAVVFAFALLHDAMRRNDQRDPLHGPRAAALARDLHRDRLLRLADHQLDILCTALAEHADGTTTDDPTTAVCWDADRLTLARVGISPKPALLSSSVDDWAPWVARWDGVWASEEWPELSLAFALLE